MKFQNRSEAEKARYGRMLGRNGQPYNPNQCAESVSDGGRWADFHQCKRKPGFGPDGIYCKTHDPAEIKRKQDAQDAKWKAQRRAEYPKYFAAQMLKLLRESQTSIGGDWRTRRDALIAKIDSMP